MHIAMVAVQVKPEFIDAFISATKLNAQASREEPGVVRFDILQQSNHPDQFTLVEVYRTSADPARHKETQHYLTWRETVAEMMAAPRTATIFHEIDPPQEAW